MCGIVGFTGRKKPDVLRKMADSIRHRGPDDEGYYESNDISLGMRRLSIVDLNGGKQPITNEDGSIITVFNGEIYNHEQIRGALEGSGHIFRTSHSDTETVVHLYEQYGEKWPVKGSANGMWGLAIWDAKLRRLLLYRDRIGKKPLYYACIGEDVVFASEIKSVLSYPGVSSEIDYASLLDYFANKNTSAPNTIYKHIKQVMPGEYVVWECQSGIRKEVYWSLDFSNQLSNITVQDAAAELLRLLDDAVRIRMKCDATYGAYLSGGVDSSAVVSLMNRHQKVPVQTFCLGYSDGGRGQFKGKDMDILYSRDMSKRLGTDHFEEIIGFKDYAESLPDVLGAFDEPFSGTVSTFYLTPLMAEHVKVALSGDGADELFGSYLSHRLAFPISNWLALKAKGRAGLNDLTTGEKSSLAPFEDSAQFDFMTQIADENDAVWRGRLQVFQYAEIARLLSPDLFKKCLGSHHVNVYNKMLPFLTGVDPLNRALEMDQRELLPNQVLPFVDRLSMAHSVEVRCPFLDYRIIEFANSLPGKLKIHDGINKYVHKMAMQKILPCDLLARPKEGFVQPVYDWMHMQQDWIIGWLDKLPGDWFSSSALKELTAAYISGNRSLNAKIWNLTCLSVWINKVRI